MGSVLVGGTHLWIPNVNVVPHKPTRVARSRRCKVNEIILHDSVTRSVGTTERVLDFRKLSAHFIIGPNGEVHQYHDVAHAMCQHAGRHNKNSVGIEIVNPYYPKYDRKGGAVISAPWAHEGFYVLPTLAQMKAVCLLVEWLTLVKAYRIDIPAKWPYQKSKRYLRAKLRRPGIYAHGHFKHSDGFWACAYTRLRAQNLGPSGDLQQQMRVLAAVGGKYYDR